MPILKLFAPASVLVFAGAQAASKIARANAHVRIRFLFIF